MPESVSPSIYVSVAYRYWNGQWSREKNLQVYGADASEEGLGGNFRLQATVRTQHVLDPGAVQAILAAPLARLKGLVDHQCLFQEIPQFRTRPSSLENICEFLAADLFQQPLNGADWESLTVWETESLGCQRSVRGEVDLHMKCLNLMLTCRGPVDGETGLLIARPVIEHAVRQAFLAFSEPAGENWGQRLFATLKRSLSNLRVLRIDLGSQEYLQIQEPV